MWSYARRRSYNHCEGPLAAAAGVETFVDQYASFRNAIPALADAKVKGDAITKEWAWAMDFLCPVFLGRSARHTAAQDAADLATITLGYARFMSKRFGVPV